MKIKLLVIGKTDDKNLVQLIENYQKRLQHYIGFQLEVLADIKNVKNLSQLQQIFIICFTNNKQFYFHFSKLQLLSSFFSFNRIFASKNKKI